MPNLTKYDIVHSVQELVSYVKNDMDLNYFNKDEKELGKLYKFKDSNGREFYGDHYIIDYTPTETGVVEFKNGEIKFSNYGRRLSEIIYGDFEEYSNKNSLNSPGSKSKKRSPGSMKRSPGSSSRKRFNGGRSKLGRKTRSKK